MMSMASFGQEVANNNNHISPIWSIPGFKTSFCIPELMHVCDLGISEYLMGNICWDLFKQLHGTRRKHKEATSILCNMALLVAKSLGIQAPFNFLRINMIRSQGKKKQNDGTERRNMWKEIVKRLRTCLRKYQNLQSRTCEFFDRAP